MRQRQHRPIYQTPWFKWTLISLGITMALILFMALCGWLIYTTFPEWDKRGQFGDMFGSINTLFSGLAFVGLILTIALQWSELSIQREEIKEATEAQKKSEETLRKRIAIEQDLIHKRLAIDLYNEWHSHEFMLGRKVIHKTLGTNAIPAFSLSLVSTLEQDLFRNIINEYNTNHETFPHILRLVRFFEKWAMLTEVRQIDAELTSKLLQIHVTPYRSLIEILYDNETEFAHRNLLKLILKHVFKVTD